MTRGLRTGDTVTVFGGSGFVGRYLVRALTRRGLRVRVAVRRPNLAMHVKPLGDPGQVEIMQANIRDEASTARALRGASGVVNLVGILQESGHQTFADVQAEGARRVARCAATEGVASLVQMSALGAAADSPSSYARTKAQGEAAVREIFPAAAIVRPSIIFGPEDDFFNRFAAMARLSPALPLIGGGHTRFQPVYVKDVAEALALLVAEPAGHARTYELGGPEILTFREILELILRETGRNRLLVPLPFGLASVIGSIAGILPGAPITRDQVALLRSDNVVSDAAVKEGRTITALGINPAAIEAIVPAYLVRFRRYGEFDRSAAAS